MPLRVPRPAAPLSLDALIRLARAGEPRGIGGLYDLFAPRLLRIAWRLTGAQSDAEDVVHDVFVGLPEALRRYEERGNFGMWLAQVTARVALMQSRAERRRRESSLIDAECAEDRVRSDHAAAYRELEQHIAALPDSLRMVFVLREIEGFKHDEIAELLGISPGASRVRLSRAIETLRAVLRPESLRTQR